MTRLPNLSVTDEMALEVRCPLCKATPGQLCTYLHDKPVWMKEYDPVERRNRYFSVGPRKGEPTARPHNERRAQWWARHRAVLRRRATAEALRVPPAVAALHAYDMAQYRMLRDWLVDGGAMLLMDQHRWERTDGRVLRGADGAGDEPGR